MGFPWMSWFLGSLLVRHKYGCEKRRNGDTIYGGWPETKELLLLSGGITTRYVGETVFNSAAEHRFGGNQNAPTKALKIGGSEIPHRVIKAPERKRPRRRVEQTASEALMNPKEIAERWE